MLVKVDRLFEAHLTVADLGRSLAFYRDRLGLDVAAEFSSRRVAFLWLGSPGHTMLGLGKSERRRWGCARTWRSLAAKKRWLRRWAG